MKKVFLILFASMAILACNTQQKEGATGEKGAIFLTEFDTPYGTPPFDRITFEDYKPAFMAGMKQQTEEVNAIINNTEEPTFENTIEALDNSGAILTRVSRVFYGIRGANTNDSIRALAEELSPILSEHNDNIYLNEQLFARIKAIHDDTASMNLTTEQYRLLDEYYKSFVRSGIMLSEDDKSRLREINKELSGLTLRFGNNLLNETNSYKLVIDNEEDLAGLPEAVKATAASAAKAAGEEGKWVFGLQKPSWLPFLQYADNRDLREKLYKAMYMRGDNDNENFPSLSEIVSSLVDTASIRTSEILSP